MNISSVNLEHKPVFKARIIDDHIAEKTIVDSITKFYNACTPGKKASIFGNTEFNPAKMYSDFKNLFEKVTYGIDDTVIFRKHAGEYIRCEHAKDRIETEGRELFTKMPTAFIIPWERLDRGTPHRAGVSTLIAALSNSKAKDVGYGKKNEYVKIFNELTKDMYSKTST